MAATTQKRAHINRTRQPLSIEEQVLLQKSHHAE